MNEQIKINWYRSKVDKAVMSELMKRHDGKALRQALLHLGLYACTGTAAYLAYGSISQANWVWMVPSSWGSWPCTSWFTRRRSVGSG